MKVDPILVYQGLCIIALGFAIQGMKFTIRAVEEAAAVSILPILPWLPSHIPKSTEEHLIAA